MIGTTNASQVQVKELSNQELIKLFDAMLQEGIVHFAFKKKDGTIRNAFGTNHPDWYIPVDGTNTRPDAESEERMVKKTLGITHYYDIEAIGWRSFISANLITVYL